MRSGDAVEPAADPRAESALGSEASSHAPSAMVPTRGGLFVWPAIYGNEGHFVWPTIYGNGGRFVRPAIYGNGGRFVSPAIYGHGGRLVRPAVGQDDQRERRGEGGGWRGWGWEGRASIPADTPRSTSGNPRRVGDPDPGSVAVRLDEIAERGVEWVICEGGVVAGAWVVCGWCVLAWSVCDWCAVGVCRRR